jgi:hypothetical protein
VHDADEASPPRRYNRGLAPPELTSAHPKPQAATPLGRDDATGPTLRTPGPARAASRRESAAGRSNAPPARLADVSCGVGSPTPAARLPTAMRAVHSAHRRAAARRPKTSPPGHHRPPQTSRDALGRRARRRRSSDTDNRTAPVALTHPPIPSITQCPAEPQVFQPHQTHEMPPRPVLSRGKKRATIAVM